MTAIHAAKIRDGNFLEDSIYQCSELTAFKKSLGSTSKEKKTTDFSDFSKEFESLVGTTEKRIGKVRIKRQLLESKRASECDMIFVDFETSKVYVYEIKAGANFDTKKAPGELAKLRKVKEFLEKRLPSKFLIEMGLVLWGIDDIQNASFKDPEADKLLTNGQDFAKIVKCSYSEVEEMRQANIPYNQKLFFREVERAKMEINEKNG